MVIDGRQKISLNDSYTHAMIVSSTGGGKTTAYIMPNILELARFGHSIVVTDPSGEIYKKTKGYMEQNGYDIKTINPTDLASSSYFNPLARADNYTEISKVAQILVDVAFPSQGGNDAFWNNGAKQIIELVVKCLHLKSKKYCNLINLRHIIEQIGGSPEQREKVDRMMSKTLDNQNFETYLAFVGQDSRVFQSMLSTAKTALGWTSSPELGQITSIDTIEFEQLRKKSTILYVIVPEAELAFYSPLLNLLYSQLFKFAMVAKKEKEPYNPIFFLLDEFANIGRLPSFETIITTIRKRECSISIVLQDLAQLEQVYNRQVATIISSNCLSQLYLGGGLSYETCKKLEGILGQATVEFSETGFSNQNQSTPERERYIGRALLTADEIRTLKRNRGLYLFGNQHPTILKIKPYYKNWKWRKIK